MTPIMQTIIDKNRGDCLRAAIATLFDLEITQVPHFVLFDDEYWHKVYREFLVSCGYEWHGTGYFPHYTPRSEHLKDLHVGGYVQAVVQSRNYDDLTHAVIMDLDGLVVHDPHPEKGWEGINIIETKELKSWALIKPKDGVNVATVWKYESNI